MSASIYVSVQPQDFDVSEQLSLLHQGNSQTGAIASFVGFVRDINQQQQVASMELEHYSGMTEKSIRKIAEEACLRWPLQGLRVIHRIGVLAPSDQIVLVAVSASHRGESFAACEFVMDYLKTRAPFWKKELTAEGARWVDARDSDQSAASRWNDGAD